MAVWQTPKTDWHYSIDENGDYQGDRFDYRDFNRIKNNLTYLRDLAIRLYATFYIENVGDDRKPQDYFYADEINMLERNLNAINKGTYKRDYGASPMYYDNGNTMDYIELNRLESATLDLYTRLTNQQQGLRQFTWNFGIKGGF